MLFRSAPCYTCSSVVYRQANDAAMANLSSLGPHPPKHRRKSPEATTVSSVLTMQSNSTSYAVGAVEDSPTTPKSTLSASTVSPPSSMSSNPSSDDTFATATLSHCASLPPNPRCSSMATCDAVSSSRSYGLTRAEMSSSLSRARTRSWV